MRRRAGLKEAAVRPGKEPGCPEQRRRRALLPGGIWGRVSLWPGRRPRGIGLAPRPARAPRASEAWQGGEGCRREVKAAGRPARFSLCKYRRGGGGEGGQDGGGFTPAAGDGWEGEPPS